MLGAAHFADGIPEETTNIIVRLIVKRPSLLDVVWVNQMTPYTLFKGRGSQNDVKVFYCLLNSDLNAFERKMSCFRGRLGFT